MKALEDKIKRVAEIPALRERLRNDGIRVVQCHGCFDIVHPGHLRYLAFARAQGDALIVSVSADRVVGKNDTGPYVSEQLRLENLAALEMVDYVVLDHHSWAGPILDVVRPDVYVKGREYETNEDPRFLKEKKLVEGYGGSVIYSSGDVVFSSTSIIGQFRERFQLDGQKITAFCQNHGIDRSAIEHALAGVAEKKVLVVGDPIMDVYVSCDAANVAAESPILSVTPLAEEQFLGGAALIAGQIVALGGSASFLTPIGDEEGKHLLAEHLDRLGVLFVPAEAEKRPVFRKTRYLVRRRKVFKVNEGRATQLSSSEIEHMIERLREQIPLHDVVVVTDFGYGTFGPSLVEALAAICEEASVPYFADVSGQANVLKFPRPELVTPNEAELRWALADNESGLSNLASRYYDRSGARHLVLTLDERGVLYFAPRVEGEDRLRTTYLPALLRETQDEVGAGDVFLATLCPLLVSGASMPLALYVASAAAALQVRRIGNPPVSMSRLLYFLEDRVEIAAPPSGVGLKTVGR